MSAERRVSWKVIVGVGALLVLHVALALMSASHRSTTSDELFHVTGGYCYDRFGDFRIQPDNGVLPQRLHGLPAVLGGARFPELEGNEYWRLSDLYVIGHQFFYETGNDHWPLLMAARAVNVIFSLGLGVLVFAWARGLAGDLAGFVALALAALSPTFLAHGPMATSDMAAAFLLLASTGAFWRHLRDRRKTMMVASAVTFGLACVAKFSAVLLLPIFAGLMLVHVATTGSTERRVGWLVTSVVVHAWAAWMIIWLFYGFRYSAFSPHVPPAQQFVIDWDLVLSRIGWQAKVIGVMRAARLLPEAFLFGYAQTYFGSLSRAAFLAGEYSAAGWPSFFPLAFAWKSTPVELASLALGLVVAAWRWRAWRTWAIAWAPLLALTAVYGAVALTSRLNIGQRHLLPIYPALFIGAGAAVAALRGATAIAVAAGIGLGQFFSAASIFPYYLAYFNAFAGGPSNGWRLLVDSSLDWGQDLPALARWLRENNSAPPQPVFLSYFGTGEPEYYGIRAASFYTFNGFKSPPSWYELTGGIYCLSATVLQEVYNPARGGWRLQWEKEYQDLRRLEPQFRSYFNEPAARSQLLLAAPASQWERAWHRYELLRHARLCAYLRARGPDADAGHSILIFRVTDAELNAVLHSTYGTWLHAIETAEPRREP